MVNFIDKKGNQRTVPGYVGQTLLEVAHNNGIDLSMDKSCSGEQSCGMCHVLIANDWYNTLPQTSLYEDFLMEEKFRKLEKLTKKCVSTTEANSEFSLLAADADHFDEGSGSGGGGSNSGCWEEGAEVITYWESTDEYAHNLHHERSSRLACHITMEKEYDGLVVAVASDESDFHYHFSYVSLARCGLQHLFLTLRRFQQSILSDARRRQEYGLGPGPMRGEHEMGAYAMYRTHSSMHFPLCRKAQIILSKTHTHTHTPGTVQLDRDKGTLIIDPDQRT